MDDGVKFSPAAARGALEKLTTVVVAKIVSGERISGDVKTDTLVAVQVLTDAAAGTLDLGTWADGAGLDLTIRVLKTLDPAGWAGATASADQKIAELGVDGAFREATERLERRFGAAASGAN